MILPGVIYPSRKHAAKVFEKFFQLNPNVYKTNNSNDSSASSSNSLPAIYHEGSLTRFRDDTDRELPFHQEANFMYLTGASNLPGASVIVTLNSNFQKEQLNSKDNQLIRVTENDVETTLFIPTIDPIDVMWSGLPPSIQQIRNRLSDLSEVRFKTELNDQLQLLSSTTRLLTLPFISNPIATSSEELLKALHEARTTKTIEELQIMAHANQISSGAHECVMRALNTDEIQSESEAESIFLTECRRRGANYQAYEPIFAYGTHAGTLHYISNDSIFPKKFKGVILIDAGCEFLGYASDITRTLPLGNNGIFTDEARAIYSIVLEMQNVAIENIKPGIEWEEIQILMHKVAAKGLLNLGVLCNLTIDECYEKGHVMPFFPHGVGHFLGLDTHDVGGLPRGKGKHPTLKYLRLQRKLEVGNVVTVEPGLYFNPFLLDPVKGSEFINQTILSGYIQVGGIRIEDNVVVTETGCNNLTYSVKSISEVEKLCSVNNKKT
ncbi:peptidase M24, structural domain-containing protein [Phakopsora pachyrhizi]|uniref:Peptidase M24, structural domain-containing protein n=1 Tax=Phakopsora pachyrhizi TaxID=170000 RepID=A0AAV0B4M4_PHAPC|nr:peptidase M24, structural domain-containing protein [Phakopsora pachyrhizi]CAH7676901.1 peptidase M24, structural domain-containing protein [Phakopsora pachyrhizi]